jgi:hypothetical protein
MNKYLEKLELYADCYLYISRQQLLKELGEPDVGSHHKIWFYDRYRFFGFFKDEIAFIINEEKVINIVITEYILWKEVRYLFYYEIKIPEYKKPKNNIFIYEKL